MKIPTDKIEHFCVALVATLGAGAFLTLFPLTYWTCVLAGVTGTIGLSLGKEYGDKNATGNHWCWWDLLFDLLGIIAAVIVFLLVAIIR